MPADGLPIAGDDPAADRRNDGWLLRTLKPGDRVILADVIVLELRMTDKGRPRIAIQAPRAVRAAWSTREP